MPWRDSPHRGIQTGSGYDEAPPHTGIGAGRGFEGSAADLGPPHHLVIASDECLDQAGMLRTWPGKIRLASATVPELAANRACQPPLTPSLLAMVPRVSPACTV